jgi:hypothetical protein
MYCSTDSLKLDGFEQFDIGTSIPTHSLTISAETFPGAMFSTAVVSNKHGVEVISSYNEIDILKLKNPFESKVINIPKEMCGPHNEVWEPQPYAARSEEFLAITPKQSSAIHIFTPDGIKCLYTYIPAGEVCQLSIEGKRLYVVTQHNDSKLNLMVYNLELDQNQKPIKIDLPKNIRNSKPRMPISFGKEHLIYTQDHMQGSQIYALELSSLQFPGETDTPETAFKPYWIEGPVCDDSRYLFADEKVFIEVIFKKDRFDLAAFIIGPQGFVKRTIAENVHVPMDPLAQRTDVCFQGDHLVVAFENVEEKITKIYSYDLNSRAVSELICFPKVHDDSNFHSRFLRVANEMYYLMMCVDWEQRPKFSLNSHLITFKFG